MITGSTNPYMVIAHEWMHQAYRPATQRHHKYVIRLYTGLASRLGLDHMNPDEEMAISFVTFLACNFKTQKSVKSMTATLVACLQRAGINTQSFKSTKTSLLGRSVSINKRAPTQQRPPIDINMLERIVVHLRQREQNGNMLAAAILIMFTTAVRQSNIFPTSQKTYDASRQLTQQDVIWREDYVKVNIKWGKAQQKVCTKYQKIPKARSAHLCTYTALIMIPRPQRNQPNMPLICFPDGNPVPIAYMTRKWKLALRHLRLEDQGFTLHSLRRGGARYLQDPGVETSNIARHAGWRSSAINDYVNAPGMKQTYAALHALA